LGLQGDSLLTKTPTAVQELAANIRAAVGGGRSIAFVSGKFNVVHPGHLRLLKFASENADAVVVGLLPDSRAKDALPLELRLEAVRAVSLVDQAFAMEAGVEEIIAALKPEIVVKGKEYQKADNAEQTVLDSYGGKLMFGSGEITFSSLNLLRNEFSKIDFSSIHKPVDYPQRHGFDFSDLRTLVESLSGLRTLVIGDLIVDKYVTCDALGMSQEDPTLVVTPIEETTFLGAAGIVAAHARGLGADVKFLTVCGVDEAATFAENALKTYGVQHEMLVDKSRPTTTKTRYRASGKTLLRVNRLRQHAIDEALAKKMIARAEDMLEDCDLLLLSDFNYGCLPQSVVDAVIAAARKRGVKIAADSQASSQLSDISRFRGVDLVTPTEREARLALQDFESGLVNVVENLRARSQAKNIIVTLGGEGLLCYGERDGEYVIDRLQAFNSAPKDVAGAGDSLITATSLALCAGKDIWMGTYLGALTAACQVGRVGNKPLTSEELLLEIAHIG